MKKTNKAPKQTTNGGFVTEMAIGDAPARKSQQAVIKSSPQWLEITTKIDHDNLAPGRVLRIDCATIPVKERRKGLMDHLKAYVGVKGFDNEYEIWSVKHEDAVYIARKEAA